MPGGEVIFQGSARGQSLTAVPSAGPKLPSLRQAPAAMRSPRPLPPAGPVDPHGEGRVARAQGAWTVELQTPLLKDARLQAPHP